MLKWKTDSQLQTHHCGHQWGGGGGLSPSHPKFCDAMFLHPFFEYMLTIPMIERKLNALHVDSIASFKSECNVFKKVIHRKFDSKREDVGEIYLFLLQNYSDAAPILTALYKLCVTCGYASAKVECLFLAMTYVDAPRRRKSESWRECALTPLLFEKEMVRGISFNESATEWLKKPRSLFF